MSSGGPNSNKRCARAGTLGHTICFLLVFFVGTNDLHTLDTPNHKRKESRTLEISVRVRSISGAKLGRFCERAFGLIIRREKEGFLL